MDHVLEQKLVHMLSRSATYELKVDLLELIPIPVVLTRAYLHETLALLTASGS